MLSIPQECCRLNVHADSLQFMTMSQNIECSDDNEWVMKIASVPILLGGTYIGMAGSDMFMSSVREHKFDSESALDDVWWNPTDTIGDITSASLESVSDFLHTIAHR